jgi:uncharacterized membrane protein
MLTWILTTAFVVVAIFVLLWIWHEIRMDRLAEQDRNEWAELTRPFDERLPPRNDL